MNIKAFIYKALKALFVFAGFPLMIMLMIITLAPMFDAEVMGNYAQNWIIVFTVLWVVLVAVYFVLEKFVGKKSDRHHKIVLGVVAILSVLCTLLPTAIYDAVNEPKYSDAKSQLVGDVNVRDYDAVSGWHRDFTERYESDVYALINENYDFCKMYTLSHTYSEWYVNADKEHNLGYKYGSFEKAEKLVADKLEAKENLEKAQAELALIEAEIEEKLDAVNKANEALAQDPENQQLINAVATATSEYDAKIAEYDDDLVRLKGQRVNIAEYKGEIIDILLRVLQDKTVLPDGLTISIAGIDLPIGSLLDTIMQIAGGVLNADTLNDLIPDVIYTGLGAETVSTYQKAVDGSDSDVSLAQAQRLDFMYKHYPQALASGAVKYISYICVGIIVFSIFACDYFNAKQKEEESKADNKEVDNKELMSKENIEEEVALNER